MRNLPPIIVDDTVLVSTTVPEVPPAAYAAGTSYALAATCSTGTVGGVISVWQSLQAGNVGHDPATSPTWWKHIGDTYAPYASGTSYALGAKVLDATSHMIYLSLVAANAGNALTDTTKWASVAPSNARAMFDLYRNTRTIVPGSLTVVLNPGQRCDAACGFNIVADRVTVKVLVGGVEKFSDTRTLNQRLTDGWYGYFFGAFSRKRVFSLWDLPPYSNAQITMTFEIDDGNVEVGEIVIGSSFYFGDIEYSPHISAVNLSAANRDQWGNGTLVKPDRDIPTNSYIAWIKRERVPAVHRHLSDTVNGVVSVWSGLDDDTHDYAEPLFILGYCTERDLDPAYPKDAKLTVKVEEI